MFLLSVTYVRKKCCEDIDEVTLLCGDVMLKNLEKTAKWRKGQEQIKLVKMIGEAELGLVANRLKTTEGAIRQRLYRLRLDIAFYTWFLNNIRNLQKNNPRIRKLTTSGSVTREESEEEIHGFE